MAKRALALHVVEKGLHPENFRRADVDGEWFSGNWVVSDATADGLVGWRLYLHDGQLAPSHSGGEVLAWVAARDDPKRKVFRFRVLGECVGCSTAKVGWANEKKIEWGG